MLRLTTDFTLVSRLSSFPAVSMFDPNDEAFSSMYRQLYTQYQTKVFFDLETTGLDTKSCEIIQLSAVCGSRTFNAYTVPLGSLSQSASNITGFTVCGGRLFCRGIPMSTISLYHVLTSFIEFLSSFPCPILLVAHNARLFDAPVLARALRKYSLWSGFEKLVVGFLDTFLLCKNSYPGLGSYSQVSLVSHYLGKSYNAHDAQEDARMLQELFDRLNPNHHVIDRFIYKCFNFWGP